MTNVSSTSTMAPGASWLQGVPSLQSQEWRAVLYTIVAASVLLVVSVSRNRTPKQLRSLPLLNPPNGWFLSDHKAKFVRDSVELIAEGREKYPDQPYRIAADATEYVVFPPKYADEIKMQKKANFEAIVQDELYSHFAGFEVVQVAHPAKPLAQIVTTKHLQKKAARFIEPYSSATAHGLSCYKDETKVINLFQLGWHIGMRQFNQAFVSKELARDDDWIVDCQVYLLSMFALAQWIRLHWFPWKGLLRWRFPIYYKILGILKKSRAKLAPMLKEREAKRIARQNDPSSPVPDTDDVWDWFEDAADGMKYDPTAMYFGLLLAAIGPTADLMAQCMIQCGRRPDVRDELRKEMETVFKEHGSMSKAALADLTLMDSMIKECQRIKPVSLLFIRRHAEADITFSSGLTLPSGTRYAVDNSRMHDPTLHEDPLTWDPYRFKRMAEENPEQKATLQAASVTSDHYAFGLGPRACPGRGLAIEAVKVFMCHMINKYDWVNIDDDKDTFERVGVAIMSKETASVEWTKRDNKDFDLDNFPVS